MKDGENGIVIPWKGEPWVVGQSAGLERVMTAVELTMSHHIWSNHHSQGHNELDACLFESEDGAEAWGRGGFGPVLGGICSRAV
jgi:hypothetical protein